MNASSRPRKLAESPRPMMIKSGPGSIIDGDTGGLNGTDNPLWIDQEICKFQTFYIGLQRNIEILPPILSRNKNSFCSLINHFKIILITS